MKISTPRPAHILLPAALIALSAGFLWTNAHAEDPPPAAPAPDAAAVTELKFYDIHELLQPPINNETNLSDFTLSAGGINTVNPPQASSGASTGLFTNNGAASQFRSRDDLVKEIIDTIKTTIAPDSWRDAGGQLGAIRELNDKLIVTQSPANQDAIKQLLAQIQNPPEIPLLVEERVIAVDQKNLAAITEMGPRLTAKQASALLDDSNKIKLLAAPRIQLLSGSQAFTTQDLSQNFTESFTNTTLDATTQPAAPARDLLEPVIGNIDAVSGITVRAIASKDLSTITLKLRQKIMRPKLSPAKNFPGAAGDKGLTTQSPAIESAELDNTLLLPEGQYAVLGGNRLLPPGSDKDVSDADNPFILYLIRASVIPPAHPEKPLSPKP